MFPQKPSHGFGPSINEKNLKLIKKKWNIEKLLSNKIIFSPHIPREPARKKFEDGREDDMVYKGVGKSNEEKGTSRSENYI